MLMVMLVKWITYITFDGTDEIGLKCFDVVRTITPYITAQGTLLLELSQMPHSAVSFSSVPSNVMYVIHLTN